MSYAKERLPKRLQHLRWARNGSIPDAWPIRCAVDSVNTSIAYAKKCFLNACAPLGTMAPGAGPTTVWRARMRTGVGTTQLRFKVIMGFGEAGFGGGGSDPNPYIEISVTPSGGSPETKNCSYGSHDDATTPDPPNSLAHRMRWFAADPLTVYEIAITAYGGARPLSVTGYEWAEPTIDEDRGFAVIEPAARFPILDTVRQSIVNAAVDAFLNNRIHLFTWSGLGTGSARTISSATFTNLVDGSSTTTSASTPGQYWGAEGAGDGALTDLEPWCRLKDGDDLPVTISAYAVASSAAATGQVRFEDSAGNGFQVGSIDNSSTKWWSADTTWQNVSAIASSGKMDIKARNTTGGQSVSVYAVSAWIRAA